MNTKNKDIIITGFALFAMFFGAGNLIFPPYLGVITGDKFLIGFLGFIPIFIGIKELYEEYKEITVVDFDEDLDEIEME